MASLDRYIERHGADELKAILEELPKALQAFAPVPLIDNEIDRLTRSVRLSYPDGSPDEILELRSLDIDELIRNDEAYGDCCDISW